MGILSEASKKKKEDAGPPRRGQQETWIPETNTLDARAVPIDLVPSALRLPDRLNAAPVPDASPVAGILSEASKKDKENEAGLLWRGQQALLAGGADQATAPYMTANEKATQIPYAVAETPGLRINHPEFSIPPQVAPTARNPEFAGIPPQIAPAPLQQPDMAQSDVPPDLASRLKEILGTTAPPEPVQSDISGGIKSQPLPFVPPPQAERDLNVVNVPPPPDMQPRGGIQPLSKSTGMLMRLPQIKTDIPAVARNIQEGKPVQANNTTVTKSMPPAIAPLLQPEHKTGNRVVVSLADKRVVVYGPDGIMRGTFPVFIGSAKDPTPEGQFRILENMTPGPSEWYYGGHWLGFAKNVKNPSADYMGFHGWTYTKDDDDEEKVNPGWKTQTHGCVQLDNKDIRKFAGMLGAGDPVTIVKAHLTVPGVQKPRLPGM
jgi:lipoprotein-anchoring transpeptidase ErfK/SrfK